MSKSILCIQDAQDTTVIVPIAKIDCIYSPIDSDYYMLVIGEQTFRLDDDGFNEVNLAMDAYYARKDNPLHGINLNRPLTNNPARIYPAPAPTAQRVYEDSLEELQDD